MTTTTTRQSTFPIEPQFLQRWSPRAFDRTPLACTTLMSLFEAARWAPSAYNVQPWRFVYSLRDDSNWFKFLDLLDPFNTQWAKDAGALVFLISSKVVPGIQPEKPFPSHSFDAGSAWIQLALQAVAMGYQAHAMGGIFRDKIRKTLGIPEEFQIEIGIAIGRPGDAHLLPEHLKSREAPSDRVPLQDLIYEGKFGSSRRSLQI